jgi:hypothetical protein
VYGSDTSFPVENAEDGKYKWYGDHQTGKSKIFLLSADDATNPQYFVASKEMDDEYMFSANSDRDAVFGYWLRSTGDIVDYAAVVRSCGQVDGNGISVSYDPFAVRPALKIDLSSPVFTSVIVSYAENAGDIAEGTWAKDGEYSNPRCLTFGGYNGHALKWRVLEVKDNDPDFGGKKTAFLVLDGVLRERDGTAVTMSFDADTADGIGTNNFPASDICLWLNDTFVTTLAAYQGGILDTVYGPGTPFPIHNPEGGKYKWYGDTQTGRSKIFLLTVDDTANPNYFINGEKIDDDIFSANSDRDLGHEYWLRSPGIDSDYAAVVLSGGQVVSGGNIVNDDTFAVRPALKIDLSSPVFTSVLVTYENRIRNGE